MGRILIVDDDEGVRSFLVGALEDRAHELAEAGDGAEGLALARRRGFDVVVTDLKMPRLDGLGLLRTLHAEQPELAVVVLTAHGGVKSAVEAMRLGALDFLEKPLSGPAELRIVVERALYQRRQSDSLEAARVELPPLGYGSPAMQRAEHALRRVARTETTVLVQGETGTGKELAARYVHAWSPRKAGPFVAVNCAALSPQLLESELFGHEKGAFTGATARKRGKLELAAGGTFFLDEIGELALPLQAKLLRVLQERRFERVGGTTELAADIRLVSATHRDLQRDVAEGRFREDLFHRIAVFPVQLPALRERPEDLAPLAEELLRRLGPRVGRPGLRLAPSALAALRQADFRGNVRELGNVLERAAILADGQALQAEDLWLGPPKQAATLSGAPTLEEAERAAIQAAVALHDGNRRKAAEHLGIGERTLYDKLKKYGMR